MSQRRGFTLCSHLGKRRRWFHPPRPGRLLRVRVTLLQTQRYCKDIDSGVREALELGMLLKWLLPASAPDSDAEYWEFSEHPYGRWPWHARKGVAGMMELGPAFKAADVDGLLCRLVAYYTGEHLNAVADRLQDARATQELA